MPTPRCCYANILAIVYMLLYMPRAVQLHARDLCTECTLVRTCFVSPAENKLNN